MMTLGSVYGNQYSDIMYIWPGLALSLHATYGNPFGEVLLGQHEEDEDWQ